MVKEIVLLRLSQQGTQIRLSFCVVSLAFEPLDLERVYDEEIEPLLEMKMVLRACSNSSLRFKLVSVNCWFGLSKDALTCIRYFPEY